RRARPGHDEARRTREEGRPEAAHRGRGALRAAGPAVPVAAVRFLVDRPRQRDPGRGAAREAGAGDRDGARGLGRRLTSGRRRARRRARRHHARRAFSFGSSPRAHAVDHPHEPGERIMAKGTTIDAPARFSRWQIRLHWLTLLLIAIAYGAIEA